MIAQLVPLAPPQVVITRVPEETTDGGGCDVYDGWAARHTWRDWSDQMNKTRSDTPPNMVSGISLIFQRNNWEWNLIMDGS